MTTYRSPSIFKSSGTPPLLDPRINPSNDYETFKSQAYDVLCCYKTIVDYILTRTPISLTILEKTLKVRFRYPMAVIMRTIAFISNNSLKDVDWIERENVREPLIKLRDPTLSRVPPSGPCTFWQPSKR